MFGHNVVKNDQEYYNSTDPRTQHGYGTFLVPNKIQSMLLRPPSSAHDDSPFSNQFMSTQDIGAYTLLALSPAGAAVDPSLRPKSDLQSSPLTARKKGSTEFLQMSPMRAMRPFYSLEPAQFNNHEEEIRARLKPETTDQAYHDTKSHASITTLRGPRRTKRYQYWTPEEDDLVRDLREVGGWTWKGISSELHRRLSGVHTWQAVQMRYLRTSKNRGPGPEKVGKLRSTKACKKKELINYAEPPIETTPPLTIQQIETAVEEDWHGRWLRISAKMGADLNQEIVREQHVKQERPSPELQLYLADA